MRKFVQKNRRQITTLILIALAFAGGLAAAAVGIWEIAKQHQADSTRIPDDRESTAGVDTDANDRDLRQLQGKWLPSRVFLGGPVPTEARAILGGVITIREKQFSQIVLSGGEVIGTITRIDAMKTPKEIDITFDKETNMGIQTHRGKAYRCVYFTAGDVFEILWVAPGATRPKALPLLIRNSYIGLEDGQRYDQCVRFPQLAEQEERERLLTPRGSKK